MTWLCLHKKAEHSVTISESATLLQYIKWDGQPMMHNQQTHQHMWKKTWSLFDSRTRSETVSDTISPDRCFEAAASVYQQRAHYQLRAQNSLKNIPWFRTHHWNPIDNLTGVIANTNIAVQHPMFMSYFSLVGLKEEKKKRSLDVSASGIHSNTHRQRARVPTTTLANRNSLIFFTKKNWVILFIALTQ